MIWQFEGIAPQIHHSAWVARTAEIMGKVHLLSDTSVWFGAVLRGDTEWITIGEGTNIQENSVLHTDPGFPLTIGAGCTIGHMTMLHGCSIGDNSLIGMSSTILNGAVIGQNCLIGAGSLITEGKVIPDGSLVMGAPGRIVRSLDQAGIDRLRASARHYQENARRFRVGLKEIE
jgi:carbonic anhydrase/acetyltransferase-like protein (isoleucine patch superfamily)